MRGQFRVHIKDSRANVSSCGRSAAVATTPSADYQCLQLIGDGGLIRIEQHLGRVTIKSILSGTKFRRVHLLQYSGGVRKCITILTLASPLLMKLRLL